MARQSLGGIVHGTCREREKTRLAVRRSTVVGPSHRESAPSASVTMHDSYPDIWTELIDTACLGIEQGLRKHRGKSNLSSFRLFPPVFSRLRLASQKAFKRVVRLVAHASMNPDRRSYRADTYGSFALEAASCPRYLLSLSLSFPFFIEKATGAF